VNRGAGTADPGADRAGRILWGSLLAFELLRIVAILQPGMFGWSMNSARFLAPTVSWPLEIVLVAGLLPVTARWIVRGFEALADALQRDPRRAIPVAAFLAAWVVWLIPDQVHFTGDFQLRLSSASQPGSPESLFPQELPLDLLLHVRLPQWLASRGFAWAALEPRLLGALEAALLALIAIRFSNVVAARGAFAIAMISLAFFGGHLVLFTGMNKAFSELVLCAAAVGVWGIAVIEGGADPLPLGLAAGLAVAMHRSGIALLPAALFPPIVALVRGAGRYRMRAALAILLPLIACALTFPAARRAWTAVDFPRLLPWIAEPPSAPALPGEWLGESLNALFALAPGCIPLLPLVALRRPAGATRAQRMLLALQIAPLLLALLVLRAPQGLFRDFDMFAPLATLGVIGVSGWFFKAFESPGRWSWLLAGVALAAAVPTVELAIAQSDLDAGLRRARAFVLEEPKRSDAVRGRTWGFLAMRSWRLGDSNAAAIAADSAVTTAPTKTNFMLLAAANQARGDLAAARSAYQRVLELDPRDWRNWIGFAEVALASRDTLAAEHALDQALTINPRAEYARELLRRIPGAGAAPAPRR